MQTFHLKGLPLNKMNERLELGQRTAEFLDLKQLGSNRNMDVPNRSEGGLWSRSSNKKGPRNFFKRLLNADGADWKHRWIPFKVRLFVMCPFISYTSFLISLPAFGIHRLILLMVRPIFFLVWMLLFETFPFSFNFFSINSTWSPFFLCLKWRGFPIIKVQRFSGLPMVVPFLILF